MGYYRGDHYRGDYYRGDPGFFSFIGKALRGAVSLIPGVGPAIGTALELRSRLRGAGVPTPIALPGQLPPGVGGLLAGGEPALYGGGGVGIMAPGGGVITQS